MALNRRAAWAGHPGGLCGDATHAETRRMGRDQLCRALVGGEENALGEEREIEMRPLHWELGGAVGGHGVWHR